MSTNVTALEQTAIDLARKGDFGADALNANLEISRLAPTNEGAWTRLARCYMEARRFADAAGALSTVLDLNPSNNIARSLQREVMRRQAMAPLQSDAASGFTAQDFHVLGRLAPPDTVGALGPKFESLLMSLNEQRTSARIVDARNRGGQAGAKLFHRNSYHAGSSGHIFAFHHGGRWEPQFNLGMFSANHWKADAFRIGIGFNLAAEGRDPEREAGQERALRYFENFQQQLATTWRGDVIDWMSRTGGFVQFGDRGPARDMLPPQAIESIVNCRNASAIGWVFCGRWLFLENPEDAKTLNEMRKLVGAVEETFAALFPLWMSTYTG
jgi:hypothetical protein